MFENAQMARDESVSRITQMQRDIGVEVLRTLLAPVPARVRELEERFEQLWEAADPERKIDE